MRPRKLRRLYTLMASAAVIMGLSLGLAAKASASPETDFLDTLTDNGLTIYNADLAVVRGYQICSALDTANGADVAAYIYSNTSFSDVPTPQVAALWVVAAAEALCPWQIHPERTATSASPEPGRDVPISGGVGGVIE